MTTVQPHVLALPWTSPPLNLNQRHGHWKKARITRQVRETVRILAISQHLPRDLPHVTVGLHYRPRDNRRRDADNLVATLKACCDGLVDFGIVADDTPDLMAKHMPTIHPATKGQPAAVWLTLEWETTTHGN